MKNNASILYAMLLVVGDFLALIAAFIAAYVLRFRFFETADIASVSGQTFIYAIVSVLPLWLIIHAFIGLYNQAIYQKRFVEIGRLVVGSFIGTLSIIGYDFLNEGTFLPGRLVPLYALVLSFGFLLVFRTFARAFRHMLYRYGFGVSNILIIGNTEVSERIARAVHDTRNTGLRVVGLVGKEVRGYRYFANVNEAITRLSDNLPHGIIQTELYRDQDKNNQVLRFAQTHHISYRFVPGNSDLFVGNITVELFADLPVVAVHQTALIGWGRVIKRLFDLSFGGIVLIIASPLMLVIALSMLSMDPKGGIFFRQNRLTRFNREFRVFKFRTQYRKYDGTTPEQAFEIMGKPELADKYRSGGDYLEKDPRVTPVGRFLRRSSLDELPQLFNVLKGDISLVGPRALIPQELNAYEKKHAILSVKSGMTGLAQISGRRDIDYEERRRLDVYYVQHWSFWLDVSILLRTFRAVVTASGAK